MRLTGEERHRRDGYARILEAHGLMTAQGFRDPRRCPVCGRRMTVFHAVTGSRKVSAHCETRGCKLRTVTLRLGDHWRLTPAQIDAYAAMNARQRAANEVWLNELAASVHRKVMGE